MKEYYNIIYDNIVLNTIQYYTILYYRCLLWVVTLGLPGLPHRFSKSKATWALPFSYSKNNDFSIKIDRGKGEPFGRGWQRTIASKREG